MSNIVSAKGLFKIFGPEPETVLQRAKEGASAETLFEVTGHTVAVQNASFAVEQGEIFVIMGLSGSGKSTLVRMLNRLIEPTAGQVLIQGRDITRLSKKELIQLRRKAIAMVFQSFALLPHLTVFQNAAFGLSVAQVKKSEVKRRAMEVLEQVGLDQYKESYPSELSGGMQQRVGLARALATDPAILLMDEAFSALDPLIRTQMQDELLNLQEQKSRTIIFISHDLDEAIRIGDRIAVMNQGSIIQVGTSESILTNPANEYVASFFRGVDLTKVLTAGEVATRGEAVVLNANKQGVRVALQQLERFDRTYGYLIDSKGLFLGVVSMDSLKKILQEDRPELPCAVHRDIDALVCSAPINEALNRVAVSPCPLPVVDEHGIYRGIISKSLLLKTLGREQSK